VETAIGGFCPIEQASNCHAPALIGAAASDTSAPWCARVTDDFAAVDSQINQVCWWGAYYVPATGADDCGPGPGDQFTLAVYVDDDGYPGALLQQQTLASDKSNTGTQFGLFDVYAYRAALSTPIDVVPGTKYWLEIVNDTAGDLDCAWAWLGSEDGNGYLVQRGDTFGPYFYDYDASFCVDCGLASDDGGYVFGTTCIPHASPDTWFCEETASGDGSGGLWHLTPACTDSSLCGTMDLTGGSPAIILTPTVPGDLTEKVWGRFTAVFGTTPYLPVHLSTYMMSGKMTVTMSHGGTAEDFVATVTMPFTEAQIGTEVSPLSVDLVMLNDCSEQTVRAVESNRNNSPGHTGPVGDRFAQTGTVTPTIYDLGGDLGDYGVFFNTTTRRGFAWANLDRSQTTVLVDAAPGCSPTEPVVWNTQPPHGSRYLTLQPGNAAESIAIRIVPTVMDPFPGALGREFWVGPPGAFPEEDSSDLSRTFTGASLQCDPYFRNWGTITTLQVYGAEIVPLAQYEVRTVSEACADALSDPASYSTPVFATAGKWGDAASPFADDPNQPPPQPDFNDIAGVVSKFTATPGAPIKALAQLQPNTAIPSRAVNFKDIAASVSAFLSEPYPYSGPCACPSTVTCGATACTTDLNCAPGFCIDDFCTDECGRCTP